MRPRREEQTIVGARMGHTREAEGGRLEELYLRHGDGAVRLAYLLTGDQTLAEDLVQDAFVKLAGRLVHLRDPMAFEAYLRRTIVNLTNSYFRRKKLERAYLAREGGRARPLGVVHDLEVRDQLWEAMRRLSERQRAALVLRYYEDLSVQEVAKILGCRTGTVKSLVSRGLEVLRSEVRDG